MIPAATVDTLFFGRLTRLTPRWKKFSLQVLEEYRRGGGLEGEAMEESIISTKKGLDTKEFFFGGPHRL